VDEPAHHFYNDLPVDQQKHWVAELVPSPISVADSLVTYAAYQHYPVTYMYCEADQTLPLKLQQMMVKTADIDLTIETCTAGHSPFLSQPESVLKVVQKITGKF
jgi:pimeloyl-ACP methyl ester carboxylesterase